MFYQRCFYKIKSNEPEYAKDNQRISYDKQGWTCRKSQDTPIIAITGLGEYPGAFATESQADKVLSKPFELSELDKAIN